MKYVKRVILFLLVGCMVIVPTQATSEKSSSAEQLLRLDIDVEPLLIRMLEQRHTHIALTSSMVHRPQFEMASEETKTTLEDSQFNHLYMERFRQITNQLIEQRPVISIHTADVLNEKRDLEANRQAMEQEGIPVLLELNQLIKESNEYLESREDVIRQKDGGVDAYQAIARVENFIDTYTLALYSYQQSYILVRTKLQGEHPKGREYGLYIASLGNYESMLEQVESYIFTD